MALPQADLRILLAMGSLVAAFHLNIVRSFWHSYSTAPLLDAVVRADRKYHECQFSGTERGCVTEKQDYEKAVNKAEAAGVTEEEITEDIVVRNG